MDIKGVCEHEMKYALSTGKHVEVKKIRKLAGGYSWVMS